MAQKKTSHRTAEDRAATAAKRDARRARTERARAQAEERRKAAKRKEQLTRYGLIAGVLVRSASVVSALLFLAFIIGISSAWARGLSIDCGCFGGGGEIPDAAAKYPGEIARDVGLLALSAWLVARPRSRWALDSVLFSPSTDDPTDPLHAEGSLDGAEEDLAQDR